MRIYSLVTPDVTMNDVAGPITLGYDPTTLLADKTSAWEFLLTEGGQLYVNGNQFLLTQFLSDWCHRHKDNPPELYILHYNMEIREYIAFKF